MSNEKLHWFSLTFTDGNAQASAYKGVTEKQGKRLRISDLNNAKETAGVSKSAVLINSTYMGLWTRDELIE